MAYTERKELIGKIEKLRGSRVVCYVTTIRPGVPGQISDDQVRVFFDHLQALKAQGDVAALDVFLVTNGGESTVPWRLVSLIREFAPKLGVLIPYKAMSAGSILALGADEIVMHSLAEMGPIDPTVSNEFNPRNMGTGQLIGIGVEDVKAYFSFVTQTVGITTDEGKLKALELLVTNVHPLALGNVDRFINQARLVGEKILRTHMDEKNDAEAIKEIIETMASKLYFHGHPINRREAREDLKLAVAESPSKELEDLMLNLYLDFETEMKMREVFNPLIGLNQQKATHMKAILQAQKDLATVNAELQAKQLEIQIAAQGGDPNHLQNLQNEFAALQQRQTDAMSRANAPLDTTQEHELIHACIESAVFSDRNESKRNYTMVSMATPTGQQVLINEEILEQAWNHYQA